MAVTPMMQQYLDAKAACGDALLLFRMGDFYELFHEDAKTVARVLGLTLTSRDKGENPVPMAGFPHHQLENYLGKLIASGFRAAVCEQMEDPKLAKGLVKRELTRVVSPGTLTDDELLDPRECNYLAAVAVSAEKGAEERVGIAWAELSTGRFLAAVFPRRQLADELARINPAECLVSDQGISASKPPVGNALRGVPSSADDRNATEVVPYSALNDRLGKPLMLTKRPGWAFSYDGAKAALGKHFGTATLEGFGFTDEDSPAVRAAGAILDYLAETQRSSLDHLDPPAPYLASSALEIDEATRRSLEICRTMREGKREGSLLAVLDRTVTAMGSRLLSDWLANPLTDIAAIDARLDAVQELVQEAALRRDLREELRGVYDLERLLARVATQRASPRDLAFIGRTLARLPRLKARLTCRKSPLVCRLEGELDLCPEVADKLAAALEEDCPLVSREGGFIRGGYSRELDALRDLAAGGKQWIARYQAEESARSGIPNLKVAYNKVFGYYIELTNTHREKAPAHYIRKQTVKNAERYITPELKEYEEKVLSADEKAKELEYELFLALREAVQGAGRRLQATAAVLAQLDVLASLAELAAERNYCRPKLAAEPVLHIIDGRHPVLDIRQDAGAFVPNDTHAQGGPLGPQSSPLAPREEACSISRSEMSTKEAGELSKLADEGFLLLITGPNMAGKSTYIRQVALLTLMAQMGSFVPAREATIGIADRIFARVGASDELSRGQSTFMVEMTETARILNTATARSLVILDEIGRGTSTYDGLSLAWAIVEHLHDNVGCRTLFATHYHELTDLAGSLAGVRNLNVAVKEWEENVVFLHKIVRGAADKSYGIHVARLAGVPRAVNERAKEVLAQLEAEHLGADGRSKLTPPARGSKRSGHMQLTLFGAEHPLLDKIRALDLDNLKPLEALRLIEEWQGDLKK